MHARSVRQHLAVGHGGGRAGGGRGRGRQTSEAEGRTGTWPVEVRYAISSSGTGDGSSTEVWRFEARDWTDWLVTLEEADAAHRGLQPGYFKRRTPDGVEEEGGMDGEEARGVWEGRRLDEGGAAAPTIGSGIAIQDWEAGEPSAPDGLMNRRSSFPGFGETGEEAMGADGVAALGLPDMAARLDLVAADLKGLVAVRERPCEAAEVGCENGMVADRLESVTHQPTGIPVYVVRSQGDGEVQRLEVLELSFQSG